MPCIIINMIILVLAFFLQVLLFRSVEIREGGQISNQTGVIAWKLSNTWRKVANEIARKLMGGLWSNIFLFSFFFIRFLCRKKFTLCAIQTLLRAKKGIVAFCWSYEKKHRIPEVVYCSVCWIVLFDYNYPFTLEFKSGWKLYRYESFTSFGLQEFTTKTYQHHCKVY